jgi:hypothetical protein
MDDLELAMCIFKERSCEAHTVQEAGHDLVCYGLGTKKGSKYKS